MRSRENFKKNGNKKGDLESEGIVEILATRNDVNLTSFF